MRRFGFPCLFFFCACIGILSISARTQVIRGTTAPAVLLVANQGDRSLSIIDPVAGVQIATVAEGGVTGHEVIASPDGRIAFVPIYGDSGVGRPGTDGSTMDVIDIGSRKILKVIDFGHGVRPHCPIYDPVFRKIYITTEIDETVTIVDPGSYNIVGFIPTAQKQSHMLAITHDGRRGYTANVGPGTVSVLDLRAQKSIAIIPISGQTQRISISNDDKMVFTADQTSPRLAVIDTSTNQVASWVTLPAPGYGTASTADGRKLLVTVPSLNKVAVVDLQSLKVERTIEVPPHPTEILVRPDGQVAYVSCGASAQVAAIDLSQWKVEKIINAGKGADGLAWSP